MKIQISEDQYEKLKKDIKKDDTAKFITCKNCKKKFTQTIHKGKKSDPICPTCGTHNT
jgi:rubrerythrin